MTISDQRQLSGERSEADRPAVGRACEYGDDYQSPAASDAATICRVGELPQLRVVLDDHNTSRWQYLWRSVSTDDGGGSRRAMEASEVVRTI